MSACPPSDRSVKYSVVPPSAKRGAITDALALSGGTIEESLIDGCQTICRCGNSSVPAHLRLPSTETTADRGFGTTQTAKARSTTTATSTDNFGRRRRANHACAASAVFEVSGRFFNGRLSVNPSELCQANARHRITVAEFARIQMFDHENSILANSVDNGTGSRNISNRDCRLANGSASNHHGHGRPHCAFRPNGSALCQPGAPPQEFDDDEQPSPNGAALP